MVGSDVFCTEVVPFVGGHSLVFRGVHSLKLTAISPLKIGGECPKGKLPVVFQASIFQERLLFVSGRVLY